jgi:hypothetical protein
MDVIFPLHLSKHWKPDITFINTHPLVKTLDLIGITTSGCVSKAQNPQTKLKGNHCLTILSWKNIYGQCTWNMLQEIKINCETWKV